MLTLTEWKQVRTAILAMRTYSIDAGSPILDIVVVERCEVIKLLMCWLEADNDTPPVNALPMSEEVEGS